MFPSVLLVTITGARITIFLWQLQMKTVEKYFLDQVKPSGSLEYTPGFSSLSYAQEIPLAFGVLLSHI